MNFKEAIQSGFSHYAQCSGRASRSEYWYWMLFVNLVSIMLGVVDAVVLHLKSGPFGALWSLAIFLPSFCVMVRRLHDVNRSGYWWLIGLTVIGLIPLFIWYCTAGTPGPNRFGDASPMAPSNEPPASSQNVSPIRRS